MIDKNAAAQPQAPPYDDQEPHNTLHDSASLLDLNGERLVACHHAYVDAKRNPLLSSEWVHGEPALTTTPNLRGRRNGYVICTSHVRHCNITKKTNKNR